MEINKLTEWNPWWNSSLVSDELKGKHRPAYSYLVNSVEIKEITILTGVRRSGKSTLMYQMIDKLLSAGISPAQILFVNLEDKKLIQDSLDDICAAYRQSLNPDKKAYIFLDEIHKKSDWESWLRKKYDLKTKDKFVISGSCSHLLKKEYSTLITGRNLAFEVLPLSFDEFLSFKGLDINKVQLKKGILLEETKFTLLRYFEEFLGIGGFPQIFFTSENYKINILEQYFDDILYKDIVDRYNLNAQKAKDLALYFMANFTSFISLRALRNSMKLSYDTTKDYLSYYKEAFLFFTVDHFSYSFKEQKTLPSKIYCIDNGLRNAVSFKFSKDAGRLAENLVFIELLRRNKNIYYWKNKGEVDFVLKNEDNSLTAINVTYTDDIDKRETEALLEFNKSFKKINELFLLTKNTEKNEHGIIFMPLWKWLLLEEKTQIKEI